MDRTIADPIPGPNPSGTDLRYDVAYGEIYEALRRARGELLLHPDDIGRRDAEQDWRFVAKACRQILLHRSKDLRIAAWLVEAQLAVDSLSGLRDGLEIISSLLRNFWATLYPELEDGDDEARELLLEHVNHQLAVAVHSLRDRVGTSRQQHAEVEACTTSLEGLISVCNDTTGDGDFFFGELRGALAKWHRDLAVKGGDPAPTSVGTEGEFPAVGICNSPGSKVDFTLTSPAVVAPGVPFEVFVWAHEPRERSRILARAREELNVRDLLARTKGPLRVPAGTALTVRLRILGAVIDEPVDTMTWEGESTCVSFVVALAELNPQTRCGGSAYIYANGVQIAKIAFLLSAIGAAEDVLAASADRYRTAFASYAAADRDQVLGRIQGIRKVAPELDIFLDVLSLRSGQNWEQELWRVIPASDIFYLFWSTHACKSEWVEKEWRCALRERGIGFIDPIPLQSPEESPPPPELSSLHFNDWLLRQ